MTRHLYLDRTSAFPHIRFAWKCSYMGTTEYEVSDASGTYRAKLRSALSEYERSILNPSAGSGEPVPYADQVASEIGILRRCVCDNAGEILPETVEAFNVWRATEHARTIAFMREFPERFGEDLSDIKAPPRVTGGRWIRGHGWSATGEPMAAAA